MSRNGPEKSMEVPAAKPSSARSRTGDMLPEMRHARRIARNVAKRRRMKKTTPTKPSENHDKITERGHEGFINPQQPPQVNQPPQPGAR